MRFPSWRFGLLVGGFFLATSDNPSAAPLAIDDTEFEQIAGRAVQIIDDVLAKDKPDKTAVARARAAALVIATSAQFAKAPGNARQRMATRDAALALAEALGNRNYAVARNQAKLIAAPPAVVGGPAPAPVPLLGKVVEFPDLMEEFNEMGSTAQKLPNLVRKGGALPANALTPELQMLGWQAAAVGELSLGHMNPKIAKDKATWTKYAEELKKAGQELAAAVKAKDGKGAGAAASRLNTSCVDCHQRFKGP